MHTKFWQENLKKKDQQNDRGVHIFPLSYLTTRFHHRLIGLNKKDLEGSGRGLIEVLTWHLPGNGKNHEKLQSV
jgi:hypothetical protein